MTKPRFFQIAAHSAAEWSQGNPTLLDRELVIERSTGKYKLGDGQTPWANLPYQPFWSRWGRIEGQIADQPDIAAALALRLLKSSNLSDLADIVAARANLGLKALALRDTINGGDWSGLDLAIADGGTGASTPAAARTALGLAIGTDVQAQDAELQAIAGLTSAADRVPYFTGLGTAALAALTTFGRSVIAAADAAAARVVLGLGTMALETAANYAKLAGAAFTGAITGTTARFTGGGTFGGAPLNTSAQMELTGPTFAYIILDDRSASTGRRFAFGSGFTRAGVFGIYDYSSQKTVLEIDSTAALMPGSDNTQPLGTSSRRFSQVYAGNATIATSDADEKQDIGAIPDEWLDAWGDVEWSRFRFRDAVEAKGENARWHTGLIAQRVRDAFAERGLDATRIGLLCFDRWDEVVTEDEDGVESVVIPAGERWGLRYTECFAIEAAWVRRQFSRLS
ncbi:MAG: tail fiber domain-containing protein [Sphingomonas sp.]|uniref:tail fiber domain-containing protein n=1 Tax=Sphingomonas sp. TaxID=28214 RepID=UPI002583348E|nr:tail fiber domain-containing protein [Sphingomonas sp.]MCP4025670.1 tail fiber domain-containing protein [Sphingomonas sp.]